MDRFDIDLSGVNSYVKGMDESSVVMRSLEEHGYLTGKFLYTGVSPKRASFLERGEDCRIEKEWIYAFCEEDLVWDDEFAKGLGDYCGEEGSKIAIWNRESFISDDSCGRYQYKFKEESSVSSSLVGLASIL